MPQAKKRQHDTSTILTRCLCPDTRCGARVYNKVVFIELALTQMAVSSHSHSAVRESGKNTNMAFSIEDIAVASMIITLFSSAVNSYLLHTSIAQMSTNLARPCTTCLLIQAQQIKATPREAMVDDKQSIISMCQSDQVRGAGGIDLSDSGRIRLA